MSQKSEHSDLGLTFFGTRDLFCKVMYWKWTPCLRMTLVGLNSSSLCLTSNWRQVQQSEECRLSTRTWQNSWADIWVHAGGLESYLMVLLRIPRSLHDREFLALLLLLKTPRKAGVWNNGWCGDWLCLTILRWPRHPYMSTLLLQYSSADRCNDGHSSCDDSGHDGHKQLNMVTRYCTCTIEKA